MSDKQIAKQLVEQMPETATYEDIIEQLCFVREVEAGLDDAKAGRVISDAELAKRIQEWRRK